MAQHAADLTLDRASTADQVAERLRALIWAGDLAPRSHLREVSMAKSFGVSRPTMREALRQLEVEGLVEHELHHGAVVTSLEAEDLIDLYRVRKLLELEAVRNPKPPPEALDALREAVEEMERAVAEEDDQLLVEQDIRFHAAIVAILGSPRLDRFFVQISAELRLAVGILSLEDERDIEASTGTSDPGRPPGAEEREEVLAEHRRMYERIASGREVQHLLEAHLDRAEPRLLAILQAREAVAAGQEQG
jgi:DNA-binding GntR family transcriptional regulator